MRDCGSGSFYIVDGHAIVYQAFYAVGGMNAPDGTPTNAVFGFASTLRKLIRDRRPTWLVVALDSAGPTFRHTIETTYKATRKPAPDDLRAQWPLVREFLEAMRIPVLEVPGFEADDVMATVALAAAREGAEVFLVSGDKDLEQLLSDRIRLFNAKTAAVTGPAELMEKKGITPEQVVDMMALAGDSTDNVAGVPGVGPKTACRLIAKYGTLQKVLDSAPVIGGKLGVRLRECEEDIFRTREMVRLRADVAVTTDLAAFERKKPDRDRLHALFTRLGFKTFLARMDTAAGTTPDGANGDAPGDES